MRDARGGQEVMAEELTPKDIRQELIKYQEISIALAVECERLKTRTCATCKWFKPISISETGYGHCENATTITQGIIMPRQDFGCINHEDKK